MKDRIKTVINNLTEKSAEINKTLISIDTNGNISIENFKKLLQCTDTYISLLADRKQINIYGSKILILGCDKHTCYMSGNIERIEFSEVE